MDAIFRLENRLGNVEDRPIRRDIYAQRDFYVPASYIMYLSDFCRFLLCTCEWERRG
jgi:hypothetical protein